MDATQLPHCPAVAAPVAPPRLHRTPRARAKRRKERKTSDGAAPQPTNRLSIPPSSYLLLATRPTTAASALRWRCRCRPRRLSCARRRRRRSGPRSPQRRARCGCRRRRAGGWQGRPRPRGSPCGSRPSRPTSAVTAGEPSRRRCGCARLAVHYWPCSCLICFSMSDVCAVAGTSTTTGRRSTSWLTTTSALVRIDEF